MSYPRLTPLRIALLIGATLALLHQRGCRYVDQLDARLGDYRLIQRGRGEVAPEVVVVAIDDPSIEKVGRWPWSRATVARLVDRLTEAGAAVVGFDIVQSEATASYNIDPLRHKIEGIDASTWDAVQKALDAGLAEDQMLADSVHASGCAVLGYFFDFDRLSPAPQPQLIRSYNLVKPSADGSGELLIPPVAKKVRVGGLDALRTLLRHASEPAQKPATSATDKLPVPQLTSNLPSISAGAKDLGYFNFIPDVDGSIRRVPLAMRYGQEIAVPLSLAMLRVATGAPLAIAFDEAGVRSLRIGRNEIPVATDGQLLVNFRGPTRTFVYVEAADLLEGKVPAEQVRDKLVLVGVTATGVYDLRVTPFSPAFPGVEIHANVLDNIIRGDFLLRAWWVEPTEVVLVFLLPLLLAALLHRLRGVRGAAAAAILSLGYLGISQWLFVNTGLVLTVLYPLLAIGLSYSTIAVQHYVVEEGERRKTRRALELYLSPSLAALVSDHSEDLRLGGEKRDYTVLFSDVKDFTTISESLAEEVVVEMLNVYLGAMTEVVFKHAGMLDKYIGDGIMAVWGAPLPQVDQAARACLAAFDMLARMRELDDEWTRRGWPKLTVRIGLNTGPMIFGNMGSSQHLSLTVVGDNVNLGSRLEGLNKMYGTSIMASEATIQAAGDVAVVREVDLVRVKGKLQPVRIYELLAPADQRDDWMAIIEQFASGMRAYRDRRWDDALSAFNAVLALRPEDGPAKLYVRRCQAWRQSPPPIEWDAVTTMDEK
ncbi:MAG: adenylate/guanylate cyclase domain-containing protein [Deltaproteobacteria bacterium]|nr:adenylate/guanylate cyclase domain-containing protein [Deltaproteobacteria bacterium]